MSEPRKGQAPSHMWGSSGELLLNTDGQGKATIQLAQVTLPRPAVCSVYFQAKFIEDSAAGGFIQNLTLNLYTGIGRITIPRTVTFANQPAGLSPLEFTLPFVPLHALQADVAAVAQSLGGGFFRVQVQLLLAPISHIPQNDQPLNFGMAVPGEADQMDDSLREDLEHDAPDKSAIMEVEDDEDPGQRGPMEVPPAWQRKIDRLAARLGRNATMGDLSPGDRKRLMRAMGLR